MDSWPMKGVFDIIFCRNVIIYFDKQTQRKLFERIRGLINKHTYLFIGHSESLMAVSGDFRGLGGTTYKLK